MKISIPVLPLLLIAFACQNNPGEKAIPQKSDIPEITTETSTGEPLAIAYVKSKTGIACFDRPGGKLVDTLSYNTKLEIVEHTGQKEEVQYNNRSFVSEWLGVQSTHGQVYILNSFVNDREDVSHQNEKNQYYLDEDQLYVGHAITMTNDTTITDTLPLISAVSIQAIGEREFEEQSSQAIRRVVDQNVVTFNDTLLEIHCDGDKSVKFYQNGPENDDWPLDDYYLYYGAFDPTGLMAVIAPEPDEYFLIDQNSCEIVKKLNGYPLFSNDLTLLATTLSHNYDEDSFLSVYRMENGNFDLVLKLFLDYKIDNEVAFFGDDNHIYFKRTNRWYADSKGKVARESFLFYKLKITL